MNYLKTLWRYFQYRKYLTIDKQTLEILKDAASEHHSNLEFWIDNYGMDEIEWVTACCITGETTFEELKDYNEKLGSALAKSGEHGLISYRLRNND